MLNLMLDNTHISRQTQMSEDSKCNVVGYMAGDELKVDLSNITPFLSGVR